MHEVLAPFVALSDPELPTSDISLCYGAFIKRFLPYAFNKDEEFLSLQVSSSLLYSSRAIILVNNSIAKAPFLLEVAIKQRSSLVQTGTGPRGVRPNGHKL